jgi:competence protein ComEA
LNQAMPKWRTFSSDGPAQAPTQQAPPERAPDTARRRSGRVAAALALVGAVALGGALVAALLVWTSATPAGGLVTTVGEPLDDSFGHASLAVSSIRPSELGDSAEAELIVDVAGAVMRPGLHRLEPGDRVGDAIEAAGGFAPRVDLTQASHLLNLAQPLKDGVKVLVPELGTADVSTRRDGDTHMDLNRAEQGELETLPGIGPVTARKIIDARSDARFDAVLDLRGRGVVGQAVFDDVKDLLRVSP